MLLRGSQPLALPLAHRLAANRTLAASLRAFAASGGAVLGEGSGVCTMADTLVVEGPTGAGGAHLGQTAASGAYGKETGGDGGAGTAQEDGGTVLPMFGLLRLTAHQKNCDLRRPSPCTVRPGALPTSSSFRHTIVACFSARSGRESTMSPLYPLYLLYTHFSPVTAAGAGNYCATHPACPVPIFLTLTYPFSLLVSCSPLPCAPPGGPPPPVPSLGAGSGSRPGRRREPHPGTAPVLATSGAAPRAQCGVSAPF